jgi:acyl-CoA synthetase (AMP-forming)/AMP-acid ligase II
MAIMIHCSHRHTKKIGVEFQRCLDGVSKKAMRKYPLKTLLIYAYDSLPSKPSGPVRSEFDLRALRTGVMAGSPCPIEVMKRLIADMNLREMTICYGMTETSPVSTQARAVRCEGNYKHPQTAK